MQDGFILNQIKRCNRNLLVASITLLLILFAAVILNGRYLYNFFFGPWLLNRGVLATINSPDQPLLYYVSVTSSNRVDTGIYQVEQTVSKYTRNVTSEKIVADYFVVPVEDKLLIVKSPPNYADYYFTGTLSDIPQDLRQKLINEAESSTPKLRGAFLPYMLNTTGGDFRTWGYWGLAIWLVLFSIGIWTLRKAVLRWRNPNVHPILQSLTNFGTPITVAATIDSEIEKGLNITRIGSNIITPSWLLVPYVFDLGVLRLDELVWIYKKVTKHYKNFILMRKDFELIVWNKHQKGLEISFSGDERDANMAMEQIFHRVPWIFIGFDSRLVAIWQSAPLTLIEAVNTRCKQALGKIRLE